MKNLPKHTIYTITNEQGEEYPVFNREISWLSFNDRVLQEAMNTATPLYERIKFMAIYSSNLDEFFKIRVASLRHMINFSEKARKRLDFDPRKVNKRVMEVVAEQQRVFMDQWYQHIIPALQEEEIFLLQESTLTKVQGQFVRDYFEHYVRPWTRPMLIIKNRISAFLKNNTMYLLLRMVPKPDKDEAGEKRRNRYQYASLEIPTDHCSRWLVLPEEGTHRYVMFLDDVIRYNLETLFPGYDILEAKAVKLTRDADLNIDDEYSGNLVNNIRKLIEKRRTGLPSRFVYDRTMSEPTLNYFTEAFSITEDDLLPSDRYHNFEDLFAFPRFDRKGLEYDKLPPIRLAAIDTTVNLLDQIRGKEMLLYFPYHDYDPVLAMLHHAARDPNVLSIKITLYRVAKDSRVVKALRKAAEKGIDVTVFAELKARFDEMSNILAAEKLESSGANVLYSLPGLKVHGKLLLIARKEGDDIRRYAYLGTGNFNEQTAKLYSDFGYFTSDEEVTEDMRNIFKVLAGLETSHKYKELYVAPRKMRMQLNRLIDFEIEQARAGKPAFMLLKMNSLEDTRIITKLYDASRAGVKIRLIIRGICCLVPGLKGWSEHIQAISIVDRYLEHARAFVFHHGGEDITILSSADWMSRNLSRRIEVGFEIKAPILKEMVRQILEIQWKDNVKARIINQDQDNAMRTPVGHPVQSQLLIHDYLQQVEPIVDEVEKTVPAKR